MNSDPKSESIIIWTQTWYELDTNKNFEIIKPKHYIFGSGHVGYTVYRGPGGNPKQNTLLSRCWVSWVLTTIWSMISRTWTLWASPCQRVRRPDPGNDLFKLLTRPAAGAAAAAAVEELGNRRRKVLIFFLFFAWSIDWDYCNGGSSLFLFCWDLEKKKCTEHVDVCCWYDLKL